MASDDEYHRRTAITRLDGLSQNDHELLQATVEEWLDGCNIASNLAWENEHTQSGVRKVAKSTVEEDANLGSQHSILACHEVASSIQACIERRNKDKKATQPHFTSKSITYDRRTLTVFPVKEQVSLTVLGGHSRVRADLALPNDEDGYQYQYLHNGEWEYTESTLHHRDGEWYLHLGYRKEKPEPEVGSTTQNGTVLGVDLGVNQIAVTSTARFFSAGKLNHARREFEKTRGDLQECGTQSAHRTLQQVGGREDEYVKNALHSVANGIVREALEYDCDGIIFEKLDEIRDDLPYADWHSTWAFRKLKRFVEYKAEEEGVLVDTVNPKNTSKRCNECGSVRDDNRHRDEFECQRCGNQNHADYNAAKNIAELYLLRGHQPSRGRSVSQYALKSGSRTPS
jgi:transposase, IS605 OrfB family, central region